MARTLLLVEDDKLLSEAISDYYERKGWAVVRAYSGREALTRYREGEFDLVLLDIMLPDGDGFWVCQALRRESDIPIFFITARAMEKDRLKGYELGADDYVVKPFSLPVLYAKTEALLFRIRGSRAGDQYRMGELSLDCGNREVRVREQIVSLSPKEYELLYYLMKHKGRILSRSQILDAVWGYDFEGTERVVDNHIKKLRKALGPCQSYLQTIPKAGYCLKIVVDKNSL